MRLASSRYLVGNRLTEVDIRLFTTLVRFESIYYGHFKCNLWRLVDYPNLWAYTRDLFKTLGIGVTVNLDHAKRHYYESHRTINPTGIVPKGPSSILRCRTIEPRWAGFPPRTGATLDLPRCPLAGRNGMVSGP